MTVVHEHYDCRPGIEIAVALAATRRHHSYLATRYGWPLEDEGGFWSHLDLRVKVIGGITGILLALLALYTGYRQTFGHPAKPQAQLTVIARPAQPSLSALAARNPRALAAHEMQVCARTHGLKETDAIDRKLFRGGDVIINKICDWPPPVGAAPDGFLQIRTDTRWIPGTVAADTYSEIDVIKAPCERVRATYVLDHMGGRYFKEANIDLGRVMGVTTVAAPKHQVVVQAALVTQLPPDVAGLFPEATDHDFYALRSGHVEMYGAKCVA